MPTASGTASVTAPAAAAPVQAPAGTEPRQLLLYLLIEHQSEPDRFMPLRVLEYVVMIYKRQLREWEKEHGNLDHCRLQPVLPIVLYTGTRTLSFGERLAAVPLCGLWA